ncbi:hypothetical protein CP08DC60_0891, partial [Chlamydia psittaci 08DC60]
LKRTLSIEQWHLKERLPRSRLKLQALHKQ